MSQERKVAMVTGGSRGIGRAVCLALAREHQVVVFNHYDPDEVEADKTLELLAQAGVEAEAKKFDVADPAQTAEFVDHVVQTHGRLDALVNNAGITRDALIMRMNPEQWDQVLRVNLTGAFVCLQAAAKVMVKQRGGSMVNMASVSGMVGNVGQANYAASKAGLIGLTKTAAKELAARGVRVNAIAPGFIETDMTAAVPEKAAQAMKAMIPLGRSGQPEDVAEVAAFLCSDAARYLTGQVLNVSGGMFM